MQAHLHPSRYGKIERAIHAHARVVRTFSRASHTFQSAARQKIARKSRRVTRLVCMPPPPPRTAATLWCVPRNGTRRFNAFITLWEPAGGHRLWRAHRCADFVVNDKPTIRGQRIFHTGSSVFRRMVDDGFCKVLVDAILRLICAFVVAEWRGVYNYMRGGVGLRLGLKSTRYVHMRGFWKEYFKIYLAIAFSFHPKIGYKKH